MTPDERDRLTRVEEATKDARDDIKEIKESIKKLERIASQGKGALHSALFLGGILGWVAGIGITIFQMFKGH